MVKEILLMLQGLDRLNNEFTAFVLCNDRQSKVIENAKNGAELFNLNELNILYLTTGHNIDEKTLHDIHEYYQQMVGEVLN